MSDTARPLRPRPALAWQVAVVRERVEETTTTITLILDVANWAGHLAGQHVDVRLTASDGYQAQRSYSIASAPEHDGLALTVERLGDGEVSSYLVDVLRTGDGLELRGPIGGYFTWHVDRGGPLFLVGGGSGVVPLMAMLRHRQAAASSLSATLLLSSRGYDDIIYREELAQLQRDDDQLRVVHTLTRRQPPGWDGYARRIDPQMLGEVAHPPGDKPHVFVCGPTLLVEDVATALVELGHPPARIRTERFGPTGG